ncbi:MAG: THUMP domain-containing protein [Halofilum sp. (in: g-proteobacteria)]
MSRQPTAQSMISLSLAGEVAIKTGRVRRDFRRRLCANLAATAARHGADVRVRDRRERIDIEGADESLLEPLSRVFGTQAVRLVRALPWRNVEEVVAAGEALYGDAVAGRRFAVRPRRVGPREQVSISTSQIARDLGTRLVEAGGKVDLDHPEVPVHVEVRPHDVLFFDRSVPGAGGLPVGVEGHGLALISGGFDSAVSAWQMLGRGVSLDFLLFNLAGWPQEKAVREVLHLLEQRWAGGSQPRLYIVDFRPVIAEMRKRVEGRYWQVLLKRLMVRAADQVAADSGADALVTGEAIGQVSSQTLSAMTAVAARAETPILRPLVGFDKHRIVELARHIGTAETSAGVEEFCALEGGPPTTRLTATELDREEERVGRSIVDAVAQRYRVVPHTEFGAALGDGPEIEHVPEHAAVVDLRTDAEFAEWSWPEAIHLEFDRALEHAHRLPADRPYLFCCEVGLKSAWLAETLREAGYEAYSFRGGVPAMRCHAPAERERKRA